MAAPLPRRAGGILFAGLSHMLAVCLLVCAAVAATAEGVPLEEVIIETRDGSHRFLAEVVRTPEERARGLMFREHLPPDRAMLFDYGEPHEVTMWMRNTLIPLDMIFVRADGTIHRIERETVPLSDRIIPSYGAVRAVIEVNGGTTERLGIEPGDRVRHPAFGNP